ncbi:WD40 repeat-like protein [Byssothecium circinans]|uniref:Pre-rRNA-processing protein IPI3 n=1 Tax=Byssothecium circinans TaxID=147558 RepID=A0A6A5TJ76_9PLEO|nr:WD40 repeat-like protein [Byssothecium circinans]
MLTEHFVASISAPTKANTGITKDAGIFFHEYQPLAAQRHVFKKSATAPNGLAVSSSHVFAAQADKSLVHVYSREKGNQEAVVPFPERIHSIALAAKDTVLLLGAESGRVLAWEICSGRLVSTSTSHLQPVTSLAVDATSNFFLSGSPDANVHVWALPAILSFSPDTSRSPVHTLSTHRGPISSIACGHSSTMSNIAVSASQDKSAIIWNYHSGQSLRQYLLPELPEAVALDPADRAMYIAYGDGSLQMVDFYDDLQKATPNDMLQDKSSSHRILQPSTRMRFNAESQKLGAALSLSISWDGTTLISGHTSGKVAIWDTAKRTWLSVIANLPGPVTNLHFLEPIGFPNVQEPTFKIHTVVKPKQDLALANGTATIPPNYSLTIQFTGRLPSQPISATQSRAVKKTEFEEALSHPSFPQTMLEESLAELATWTAPSKNHLAPAADFLSLNEDGTAEKFHPSASNTPPGEIAALKKQLASLQRVQKVTFEQLSELRQENTHFRDLERKRSQRAQRKAKRNLANGDDVEMSDVAGSEAAAPESSSNNESESAHTDSDEESGASGPE